MMICAERSMLTPSDEGIGYVRSLPAPVPSRADTGSGSMSPSPNAASVNRPQPPCCRNVRRDVASQDIGQDRAEQRRREPEREACDTRDPQASRRLGLTAAGARCREREPCAVQEQPRDQPHLDPEDWRYQVLIEVRQHEEDAADADRSQAREHDAMRALQPLDLSAER